MTPTLTDLSARAAANLRSTYLAIGRALPGATTRETEGYVALLSDIPHPSGNFAIHLNLDPWSAGELRDLAMARPAFQAVALPEDAPPHLPELLQRAGFGVVHRLVAMVATPSLAEDPSADQVSEALAMTPCESTAERRQAGRFMSSTFFGREPAPLRVAMAEAIVRAESLAVHTYQPRERMVAAVALTRDEDMLGIYNLCVAGAHRGKGVGSSLIAWCLAQAAAEGRAACLQCVPTLEAWYVDHGFIRTGTISIWSLL